MTESELFEQLTRSCYSLILGSILPPPSTTQLAKRLYDGKEVTDFSYHDLLAADPDGNTALLTSIGIVMPLIENASKKRKASQLEEKPVPTTPKLSRTRSVSMCPEDRENRDSAIQRRPAKLRRTITVP